MKILVTGSSLSEENFKIYKKLEEYYSGLGYEISTPLQTKEFKGSPEERLARAFKMVDEADVIIAEVSFPSHGQGVELYYSKLHNKKVICVAKENAKVSGIVSALFSPIVYFKNINDLFSCLKI